MCTVAVAVTVVMIKRMLSWMRLTELAPTNVEDAIAPAPAARAEMYVSIDSLGQLAARGVRLTKQSAIHGDLLLIVTMYKNYRPVKNVLASDPVQHKTASSHKSEYHNAPVESGNSHLACWRPEAPKESERNIDQGKQIHYYSCSSQTPSGVR